MTECHYCGRPMPRDNTSTHLPWPVCTRTCCEQDRETLTTQHLKLGWYWRPVKDRFLERARAGTDLKAGDSSNGGEQ